MCHCVAELCPEEDIQSLTVLCSSHPDHRDGGEATMPLFRKLEPDYLDKIEAVWASLIPLCLQRNCKRVPWYQKCRRGEPH